MFETYQPSGRINGTTFPLVIGGILAAAVAGYFYQTLLHWISMVYISIFITLGMGFGLGFLGAFIANVGHVRNVLVAGLIGVLLTTAGVGAKFWFQYQREVDTTVELIINQNNIPENRQQELRQDFRMKMSFLEFLKVRARVGWQLGRGNGAMGVSGWLVYVAWLIETGVIGYFAVSISTGVAREPYNEKLGAWADEVEVVMQLPITDDEMVRAIDSASSVEQLLEIPIPKTDESDRFAVYTVNSIAGEELEDAYLTVELRTFSVNKEGEESVDSKPLVKMAILTSEQRKRLIENAELLQEAIADYRAALNDEAFAAAALNQDAGPDQS